MVALSMLSRMDGHKQNPSPSEPDALTGAEYLRRAFASISVNAEFTEAVVVLRDASQLLFHHRVDERWAKVVEAEPPAGATALAAEVLARVARFRLNAKHLDIQFADGSRWEAPFR